MKKRGSWMIPFRSIRKLALHFYLCMLSGVGVAQSNLYDESHTFHFAKYLHGSRQYELSVKEYHRLLRFDQHNVDYQVGLLRNYRQLAWYDSVHQALPRLYTEHIHKIPKKLAREVAFSTTLDRHQDHSFLRGAANLSERERNDFRIIKSILEANWDSARALVASQTEYDPRLIPLAQHEFKFLNPGVAALLSTVIPGSGKWYAKRGKDGFFSLVMISSFAFQSITAFHQRGHSSVYGWITGAIGAGYYLGNIYGSIKAAKTYNRQQEETIQRDAEKILYSLE